MLLIGTVLSHSRDIDIFSLLSMKNKRISISARELCTNSLQKRQKKPETSDFVHQRQEKELGKESDLPPGSFYMGEKEFTSNII